MKKGSRLHTLGLLLIAAALAVSVFNIWRDRRAERAAQSIMERFADVSQADGQTRGDFLPEYMAAPLIPMPVREIDGVEYAGRLAIPALSAEFPVAAQWNDKNLNDTPCLYAGSIYRKNMIICGSNFKSHFGRLKHLRLGDSVVFTDMSGNEFSCTVAEIVIIPKKNMEELDDGTWPLTLFTSEWNRANCVIVRCRFQE